MCIWLYSGTSLIRSLNGPKKNGRIEEGFFFYTKMYGGFCQATKKSGRANEVTVRRGFIVFFTWVTCLPPNLGWKISLQKLPKFFGWPKRIKCVILKFCFNHWLTKQVRSQRLSMISYAVLEKRNTARRKPEVWIYSAFLPGVPSMRLVVLTFQQ